MKSYSCARLTNLNIKMPTVNILKRKDKIIYSRVKHFNSSQSRHSAMSKKTKDFIQKLCYKKTPSKDMTQYGFVNDRKMHPVNLMMKPLKMQFEKIIDMILGKPAEKIIIPRTTSPKPKLKFRNSKRSLQPPRKPTFNKPYEMKNTPVGNTPPRKTSSSQVRPLIEVKNPKKKWSGGTQL